MRVLTLDIETSPNIADVWGLWNNNVGLSQLRQSQRVICFAAKWLGKSSVEFWSEYEHGHDAMVLAAHRLISEADVVVHYNGNRFDIPHLQSEFVRAQLAPPSPHKNVDLLRTVRRQFKFPSNKLDYVASELLGDRKVAHEGHLLWTKCLMVPETPDEEKVKAAAWVRMRKYNIHDVKLTERLYKRLLPWIAGHPHVGLYGDTTEAVCGNCGSTDLRRQGYAYTSLGKFIQRQCKSCGKWSRDKKAIASVDVRPAA